MEQSFTQKFAEVQSEITAPKKKNSAVPYASRSAEQILESAKPALLKHGLVVTLDSQVIEIAGRLFIESCAQVSDGVAVASAKAQAEMMSPTLNKNGVPTNNESQLSGATGSYADKYALQKLFAIGNNDDADDAKYQPTEQYQGASYNSSKMISEKQIKLINFKLDELKKSSITAFDAYKEWYKTNCSNKKVEALTMSEAKLAIDKLMDEHIQPDFDGDNLAEFSGEIF